MIRYSCYLGEIWFANSHVNTGQVDDVTTKDLGAFSTPEPTDGRISSTWVVVGLKACRGNIMHLKYLLPIKNYVLRKFITQRLDDLF